MAALDPTDNDIQYNACGAVLNCSMDNGKQMLNLEPLQVTFLAHNVLGKLNMILNPALTSLNADDKTLTKYGMAIRIVSNLIETGLIW